MDFSSFIFLFIIFLFNLFLLFILSSVNKLFYSTNINKYKINSTFEFYICLFFLFIYIFFFIFILYLLRYINLGNTTNLIDICQIINGYFLIYLNFSLPFKIILFLIFISLVFIFLLILILLNKFITLILLKLFCYYEYSSENIYYYRFINFLRDIGFYESDIISYYIYRICGYIVTLQYGESLSHKKLSRLHPFIITSKIHNRRYNFIISISPIIFFIFEALFNNFSIHYIYYYLIIFTPLIILRRITNYFGKVCIPMKDLLWDIYYNNKEVEGLKELLRDIYYTHKGKTIIYAISPKMKPFFDEILLNDLVLEHFNGYDIFGFYFKSTVIFIARSAHMDIYCGESGSLILEYDSQLGKDRVYEYTEKEIGYISGAFKYEYIKETEWFLLCKK